MRKMKIFAKIISLVKNNFDKASSQFVGGKFRKNEHFRKNFSENENFRK
jgi:hypothetical protein